MGSDSVVQKHRLSTYRVEFRKHAKHDPPWSQ
jgi:hypothetical protein